MNGVKQEFAVADRLLYLLLVTLSVSDSGSPFPWGTPALIHHFYLRPLLHTGNIFVIKNKDMSSLKTFQIWLYKEKKIYQ